MKAKWFLIFFVALFFTNSAFGYVVAPRYHDGATVAVGWTDDAEDCGTNSLPSYRVSVNGGSSYDIYELETKSQTIGFPLNQSSMRVFAYARRCNNSAGNDQYMASLGYVTISRRQDLNLDQPLNFYAPRYASSGNFYNVTWTSVDDEPATGAVGERITETKKPSDRPWEAVTTDVTDDIYPAGNYRNYWPTPGHDFTYNLCQINNNGYCISGTQANGTTRIQEFEIVDSPIEIPATDVGSTPYSTKVDRKGAATIEIPIKVSPGRNSLQPGLSLVYNSGSASNYWNTALFPKGMYQRGWSLSGLSEIHRCRKGEPDETVNVPDNGIYQDPRVRPRIQFDNTDSICLDDIKLILKSGTHWRSGARYRSRDYTKEVTIKQLPGYSASNADSGQFIYFEVKQPDGRIAEYGNGQEGRSKPYRSSKYVAWGISFVKDAYGNEMSFRYKNLNDAAPYGSPHTTNTHTNYRERGEEEFLRFRPDRIDYPLGSVTFDYNLDNQMNILTYGYGSASNRVYSVRFNPTTQAVTSVQECRLNYPDHNCLAPLSFEYGKVWSNADPQLTSLTDGVGATVEFEYIRMRNQCRFALNAPITEQAGHIYPEIPYLTERYADVKVVPSNYAYKQLGTYSGSGLGCKREPSQPASEYAGEVVHRYIKSNGVGGTRSWEYSYGDSGFKDSTGGGFVGHHQIREIDEQTGITTYRQYRLVEPYVGMLQAELVYPEKSRRYLGVNFDPVTPLSTTFNLFNEFKGEPYSEFTESRVYDLNTDELLSVTHRSSGIEYLGNSTYERTTTTTTSSAVTEASSISINSAGAYYFANSIPNDENIVSKNTSVEVLVNYLSNGEYVRRFTERVENTVANGISSNADYDVKSKTTVFEHETGSADVRYRVDFLGNSNLELASTIERDDQGNVRSRSVTANGFAPRTSYFSGYERSTHPRESWNPAGHFTYVVNQDGFYKKPTQVLGVNNETTYTYYDGFERPNLLIDADGNETRITYSSCDTSSDDACDYSNASYIKVINSDTSPTTKETYDILNRVIATHTQGLNTWDWIKTETVYNANGQVEKQTLPFTNTYDKRYTTFAYDQLGRKLRATRSDGSYTRWIYDTGSISGRTYQRTVTVDHVLTASGNFHKTRAKVAYFNAAGQLIRSEDGLASTSPYSSLGALSTANRVITTYKYDALGNPVWVEVDGGSSGKTLTTSEYDSAGNRILLTGPNVGTIESTYNAYGELTSTEDAEGNKVEYQYDVLGRMISKSDADGISVFEYDSLSSSYSHSSTMIGAIMRVTNTSGYEATYNYNDRKLVSVTEELNVPSRDLIRTSYYTYDSNGRVDTQTYASGITVKNEYSSTGYLKAVYEGTSINSNKLLHRIDAINAFGTDTTTFGNGMKTIMDYDLETGFVSSIEHRTPTGSAMNYQTYKWHSSGNMQERGYSRFSRSGNYYKETFTYDNHDRLYDAKSYLNGSYQRTLKTRYNNLGNITSKTSTKTGDDDVTSYAYETQESGCSNQAGPHAVSRATINGLLNRLCYDKNGYITRYSRSGSDKFIEYNTQGQPTLITIGDSIDDITPDAMDEFRYNPNGQRFYKRSEFKKGSDTQVEEVFYFSDGTEITYYTGDYDYQITEKTYASGNVLLNRRHNYISWEETVQYLHKDHLGSVVAITDETFGADAVHKLAYEPFGSRRKADWTRQLTKSETDAMLEENGDNSTRGFTGHEHLDRTGFIHMNGRVYDPILGRFLTPDPLVQAPTLSQSWNRYSYVWNNPLRNADPSGYKTSSTTSTEYAQEVQRNGKQADVDQVIELPNATIKLYKNGDVGVIVKKGSENQGTKTDSVGEIGSKTKSWLKSGIAGKASGSASLVNGSSQASPTMGNVQVPVSKTEYLDITINSAPTHAHQTELDNSYKKVLSDYPSLPSGMEIVAVESMNLVDTSKGTSRPAEGFNINNIAFVARTANGKTLSAERQQAVLAHEVGHNAERLKRGETYSQYLKNQTDRRHRKLEKFDIEYTDYLEGNRKSLPKLPF